MKVAGTGHRPPALGLGYSEHDNNVLAEFVTRELLKINEITEIISGLATGFDQALAEAAISLDIPLTAAIAFSGVESKWPESGQRRFNHILERAEKVVIVCDGGYAARKFLERDRWMVEHADAVLALYDETNRASGTGATVFWSRSKGKPVINIWDEWVKWRD